MQQELVLESLSTLVIGLAKKFIWNIFQENPTNLFANVVLVPPGPA